MVADDDAATPSSLLPTTAAEVGITFISPTRVYAGATVGRPRAWWEVLDPTTFSRPDNSGEA
jgi:hypothetical protein